MRVLLFLLLVVGVPVALLVWSRRGNGGRLNGTDPQGNRDLGRHGGPPSGPPGNVGPGSGSGF
jgi:hypothetical protein